jgi:hypothetical protein
VNGIHEVMGSIPISSTNSSNNLAAQRIGNMSDLSISCLFSRECGETGRNVLELKNAHGLPSATHGPQGMWRGLGIRLRLPPDSLFAAADRPLNLADPLHTPSFGLQVAVHRGLADRLFESSLDFP